MRKVITSLAILLCLVLCVFCFASCSKKKTTGTTSPETTVPDVTAGQSTTAAPETTAAPTEHVHVPEEQFTTLTPASCTDAGSKCYFCSVCHEAIPGTTETIPAKGHVPAEEYTVDVEENCTSAGSKSYHCTVCNVSIDGTATPIPADPTKHVVDEWDEKIPHLLDPDGYRRGECKLCHAPIDQTLVWTPVIFNSKEPSGEYYDEATGNYSVRETFGNIRGDKHFFPDEENPIGNDLWFEYSLLWNETLANSARARISAAEVTGYDEPDGCEIFGLCTRDVAADDEFAGRFCFNRTYVYGSGQIDKKEGSTWTSRLEPASDCVLELGNGQPRLLGRFDETVTADSFAPIGSYGWHRIGFRYHLETDPDDTDNAKALAEPGQKASYYAFVELYVDGVKVWKIWESVVGYWDGEAWQNRSYALRPNDAVPFKLTASENYATTNSGFMDKAFQFSGIWYVDNDKRSVGMTFYGVTSSENAVYIVIDDVQYTCGDGFVREVVPDEAPTAKTITLTEGLEVPAAVYFKLKDGHVHTQAAEYTIDTPATCTDAGEQSYHCTVCGDSIPGTSVVIPAKGHTPEADYTIDLAETCSSDGSRSKHCSVCHEIIADTVEVIPADASKHVEVLDVKTPTLLEPEGYRRGECSLCHQPLTNEVLNWTPVIFDSKNPSGDYYNSASGDYAVRKTFGEIRGDKHFYPTEADHDGNDLWFEYSLLWNQTLANAASARISAVDIVGYDPCEIFGLNTRDVAADEEFAGRFCFNRTYVYGSGAIDKKEGTTWTSAMDPASDCVLALDNGQPRYLGRFDETVTADSFAPIGNYGWHRIGFRFHMESDPDDTDHAKAMAEPGSKSQKASYYCYTELYVDGVKVWKIEESITGYWTGTGWTNQSFALRPNDAVPFKLTADQTVATTNSTFKNKATEYDGIWYVDNDKRSIGLCFAGVGNSENAVYIVIDDVQWTCGDGFVTNVEPVATPVADTITLAEGVEVPAAVYFKLAD